MATLGLAAWLAAGAAQTRAQATRCEARRVPTAECFRPTEAGAARCRRTPAVSAPCVLVRGRLSVANGAPTFRLWPVGGRRLLGVFGADGDPDSATLLPDNLRSAMQPPAPGALRTVFGDFRVCPLAGRRAGWMQPVCIASADHVVPAARRPED